MATPIKIIPTLHGESARRFIERAEEMENRYAHWQKQGQGTNTHGLYNDSEWVAYQKMLKDSGFIQ